MLNDKVISESKLTKFGLCKKRKEREVPVQNDTQSESSQAEEPEPEEYVYLLVDNVERQNADCVMALDLPWHAELVEGALGHPREDEDHWIRAVFLVRFHEPDHVDPELKELAVEEAVHQEHLP